MIKLKFHTTGDIFYDESGKLKEEPRASLKSMLRRYEKAGEQYRSFREAKKKAEEKYRRTRWINDVEPQIMEDSKRNYGHRTYANAEWSDITLAIAVELDSPGEITTRKAAGDKFLAIRLPESLDTSSSHSVPAKVAPKIANGIRKNPHFNPDGIRLNIAGNSAITLSKYNLPAWAVTGFISNLLRHLMDEGIAIQEVRSGGQTGIDEYGIIAAQRLGLKCSILAPKDFRMHYRAGEELEGRKAFVARFRESYIDYDKWEKDNSIEARDYGFGDFNGGNALDMMEYDIDLKIMHMNARGEEYDQKEA